MRRRILASVGKPLPYDAEVEWIDSNNTGAFINTHFAPTRDDFWCEFAGEKLTYSANDMIPIGIMNNVNVTFNLNTYSSNRPFFRTLGRDNNFSILTLFKKTLYRWGVDASTRNVFATCDGIEIGRQDLNPIGTFVGNKNVITIFGRANDQSGTSIAGTVYFRVYGCLFHYADEIVMDLIPVRFTKESGVSDGAMYDRVSGQLFRNAGTGSFVIGPDKTT